MMDTQRDPRRLTSQERKVLDLLSEAYDLFIDARAAGPEHPERILPGHPPLPGSDRAAGGGEERPGGVGAAGAWQDVV